MNNLPTGTEVSAAVDMRARLESLKSEEIRPGHWLNIMGYVTSVQTNKTRKTVGIQAILHWSAGSLDIDKYEQAVRLESSS